MICRFAVRGASTQFCASLGWPGLFERDQPPLHHLQNRHHLGGEGERDARAGIGRDATKQREVVWAKLGTSVCATVSRFRPIMLTAISTVLGMIPIAPTVFWGPMAFAIMGGLFVATMLTLLVLPVFYITLYGAKQSQKVEAAA